MEIGKIEKFDITKIAVTDSKATPLRTKIEGLEVGQGFIIEGVERGSLSNIIGQLHKEGRRIVCHKLTFGKFQVVRVK